MKGDYVEFNPTKDYRKILGISSNASESNIAEVCTYTLLNYQNDNEMIEAAQVLNNPEIRRKYDLERARIAINKEAEDRKKAQIADAKAIEERKKNNAERKQKARLERKKRIIAWLTTLKEKRISQNIERKSKKDYEKVVSSYDNEIIANSAKNTVIMFSTRKIAAFAVIGILGVGTALTAFWNKEAIKGKITTIFDNDNNEEKENNYDALINVNAILEEEIVSITAKSTMVEKETYPIVFTDPDDEEQLQARAEALNNYYRTNKFYDVDIDEISNQTKFMNGSYKAPTDLEAYDMANSILDTIENFINTIATNDTYISGVTTSEGETIGFGLDAYLLDTCPNKEIVIEAFEKLQNLLRAKTAQEQVDAANDLLALEYVLMIGEKQNNNGEYVSFDNLDSNIGFIIGTIFQIGNLNCPSILGDNSQITYINNNGEEKLININVPLNYYNPKNNDELDYENVFMKYYIDLISTAQSQNSSYNIN